MGCQHAQRSRLEAEVESECISRTIEERTLCYKTDPRLLPEVACEMGQLDGGGPIALKLLGGRKTIDAIESEDAWRASSVMNPTKDLDDTEAWETIMKLSGELPIIPKTRNTITSMQDSQVELAHLMQTCARLYLNIVGAKSDRLLNSEVPSELAGYRRLSLAGLGGIFFAVGSARHAFGAGRRQGFAMASPDLASAAQAAAISDHDRMTGAAT